MITRWSLLATLGLTFVLFGSSAAYEISIVTQGATIVGKVVFKGKVPEPKKLLITKDEAVCGQGYVQREEVRVSQNSLLQDVVIVLEGVAKGKEWRSPKQGYVLDQKNCSFQPYLLVVPQGGNLLILNSDSILHNIHAYELIGRARRTAFNIAQPKFKPKVTRTIMTRRGSAIRVECDAHNWMLGWIYVVKNPYYTIVQNGKFVLEEVPPGQYKLKAWHPFLGTQEKEVSVPAKGKVELLFEYK